MKKILALALVAFLLWLFWPVQEQPTTTAEPPTPTPTPASRPQARSVATQHPRPPAAPRRDATADIRSWARRQGVQVRVDQDGRGKTLLKIAWQGSNATLGGDFVMKLYREGVIGANFEQVGAGRAGYDRSGRRVWMQEYRVTLH